MYTRIHWNQQLNTSTMNSDMSLQMTTPSFLLYRTAGPNDAFDPTAEIQFYPPKDSDELFDALRSAYPIAKTHSERMRNAVIDFLVEERDAEQARNHMTSTPSTLSSWPSNSTSSTFSSPDLIDLATPASATSPLPVMSRRPSRSSTTGQSSMEQMTNVFSLSANPQLKTRVRRKMTDSEKAEYRKRRIVKACDKCSKRKRKCHHNQEQMEVVKSSGKVTKQKSPTNSAPSFRVEQLAAPSSFVDELDSLSFFTDDSLFSLQGPTVPASLSLMDFDFNPQTAQAEAWPWSDTQDWTLMDTLPTHDNAAQREPLFSDFTGYTNQDGIVSPTSEHQLSTHSWQQRSTHSAMNMEQTVNPELLQAQSSISTVNTNPMVNADLIHTDEDPGNGGVIHSAESGVARISGQPTHSKRHHGGFDRSAFIGASQNASSVRPNEMPLPDGLSLGSPLVHGRAATSSGSGHGQVSGYILQSAVSIQQPMIKNKGPDHASSASPAIAGQGDGKVDVTTEPRIDGDNDRRVPTPDVRHQQGGLVVTPSHYYPAGQAAAGRSGTDAVSSRQMDAHVTPAAIHAFDFDFDYTDAKAVLSPRASGTIPAGVVSVSDSSWARLHGPVSSRGLDSGPTSESSSRATRPTAVLSPELIQAFSGHNSAAEACNEQRLAPAGSAVSTTPRVVIAGLDKGVDEILPSPVHGTVAPTPSQSSRGGAEEPRPSQTRSNTSSVAIQPIDSWTGHLSRNPLTANIHTPGPGQQSRSGNTRTETVSTSLSETTTPVSHSSEGKAPSRAAARLPAGSNKRPTVYTPSSPSSPSSSRAVLDAAKNRRIPVYHNTNVSPRSEDRRRRPQTSEAMLTQSSVLSTAADGAPRATGGRTYTGVDVALATLSLVSSGYLLGLASALTGELLRSVMQNGQRSCVSDGKASMARGLGVRNVVACV